MSMVTKNTNFKVISERHKSKNYGPSIYIIPMRFVYTVVLCRTDIEQLICQTDTEQVICQPYTEQVI